MSKTLYILRNTVQKDQDDFSNYILPDQEQSSLASTYVFIQDGLKQQDAIGDVMYGLQDQGKLMIDSKNLESISYHEVLGLIFYSDNVVVV